MDVVKVDEIVDINTWPHLFYLMLGGLSQILFYKHLIILQDF